MKETFFGPYKISDLEEWPGAGPHTYYENLGGKWSFCREAIQKKWYGIHVEDTIWISIGTTKTHQGVEGIRVPRLQVWDSFDSGLPKKGGWFYWRVWVE